MKKYLTLISLLVLLLTGCASTAKDPTAGFRDQSAEQIFCTATHSLRLSRYSRAVKALEALQAMYPFGAYAEQGDLYLIYGYYQNDDPCSAVAAADRFTHLYPRSPHIDYAYYMKGLAGFDQDRGWFQRYFPADLSQRDPGAARQSFDDFCTLVRLFPDSCYAPDARQHMVYLRNLLAAYELHVAKYYFRRGAYAAAANRANYIIQHYDGTPVVCQALSVLVCSYRELHLPELADQALAVRHYNYMNGPLVVGSR